MAQLCQSSTFLFQHPLLLHINYGHGHTSSSLPHPFVRQVECLSSVMSFTLWPRREEDTMPPAETQRTHQGTAPAHRARGRGPGDTDWASSSPPTLRLTLARHWLFARVLSCSGHDGFFHRWLEQRQDNQFKLLFILLCQALDPFFNSMSWGEAQAPRIAQTSCVKVPFYQNTGDGSSPSQRLPLLYQKLIKASFHELFCWANKFNLIFYMGSS